MTAGMEPVVAWARVFLDEALPIEGAQPRRCVSAITCMTAHCWWTTTR